MKRLTSDMLRPSHYRLYRVRRFGPGNAARSRCARHHRLQPRVWAYYESGGRVPRFPVRRLVARWLNTYRVTIPA